VNQPEPPKLETNPQMSGPVPREKILHVSVPFDAWLNARHAALDSGDMHLKDYITELLYLAAPFKENEQEDQSADNPASETN